MQKKKWEKPELIILMRGRPEEAVLTGCKNNSLTGPAAANTDACWITVACDICSVRVGSS